MLPWTYFKRLSEAILCREQEKPDPREWMGIGPVVQIQESIKDAERGGDRERERERERRKARANGCRRMSACVTLQMHEESCVPHGICDVQ